MCKCYERCLLTKRRQQESDTKAMINNIDKCFADDHAQTFTSMHRRNVIYSNKTREMSICYTRSALVNVGMI